MLQGLGELLFLGLQHALDVCLLLLQLGEGIAHLGDQRCDDLVEEGAPGAQLVAVAAGAADDPPQDVAATFVGRQHAVGDQKLQERMWSATTFSDGASSLAQPMASAEAFSRFWNRSIS